MNDALRHRISFFHNGLRRYGLVENDSPEALELEKDELLVVDSVLPKTWIVREDSATEAQLSAYTAHVTREFQKALRISNDLGLSCAKGKLLRFNVRMGYAYYVAKRINKRSVNLEWRGYSLDRLIEPSIGYKGSISIEKCEDMIAAEVELRSIFATGEY